ncbi:hypothetical protein I5M32_15935 [Pedobacter sp. SD-b]|uniref:DUF4142 domain-containing protein n=1 Tax=Pedobacter segetis TaxID=2793069 RepID=A0ABS1BNZ1_9SPHI|nr:hypothetical protein [Pedobacter segetis]MBK0384456.1 hypothetical protein [Pedobacter segetis]
MKNIAIIFLFIIASGCNKQDTKNSILEKLKSDKNFIQYMKYNTQYKVNLISDKHHLKSKDGKVLKDRLATANSSKDILEAHEAAGVAHAKEYIMLTYVSAMYYSKLKKEYPQLFELPVKEREKLFDEAYPERQELVDKELKAFLKLHQ